MSGGHCLIPSPPTFFVLRFTFSIICRSGRVMKNRQVVRAPIKRSGWEVNVRGTSVVTNYKYACNKPQVFYLSSNEYLGLTLVVEHLMLKLSMLFGFPPFILHLPHLPLFHCSSASVWMQTKEHKIGGAWGCGYGGRKGWISQLQIWCTKLWVSTS